MTLFNPGDLVSFTNEKLEGKILKSLPGNCYRVEIEDGFTLDVTAAEIVLRKTFLSAPQVPVDERKSAEKVEVASAEKVEVLFRDLRGFQLLVIPVAGQISNGLIQWWLINATEQEQLFACTLPAAPRKETLIAHGHLFSGKAVLLQEFRRDDYAAENSLTIRWMECDVISAGTPHYRTKIFAPEYPAMKQTNPRLPSPYCFTRYHLLSGSPAEEQIAEGLEALYEKFKPSPDQGKISSAHKSTPRKKEPDVLRKFGLSPSVQEIDLHIEELTDDPSTIDAAEMLSIQLAAFRRALDRALIAKQRDLTVIHGVGNGKLRAAIRRELSELGLRFQDAPFEKYGNGATRVTLSGV